MGQYTELLEVRLAGRGYRVGDSGRELASEGPWQKDETTRGLSFGGQGHYGRHCEINQIDKVSLSELVVNDV